MPDMPACWAAVALRSIFKANAACRVRFIARADMSLPSSSGTSLALVFFAIKITSVPVSLFDEPVWGNGILAGRAGLRHFGQSCLGHRAANSVRN